MTFKESLRMAVDSDEEYQELLTTVQRYLAETDLDTLVTELPYYELDVMRLVREAPNIEVYPSCYDYAVEALGSDYDNSRSAVDNIDRALDEADDYYIADDGSVYIL